MRNVCLACENAQVKHILKKLSIVVYVILLISITGKLFFEQQFTDFLSIFSLQQKSVAKNLTIGVSYPIVSNDPRANDVGSRMYLLQVFEPLVRRTSSLELESSLALSYGMLTPTLWEFRLRPSVHFHDDTLVTPEDVKKAIEHSRGNTSGVSEMLSTVESVAIVGDSIRIETNAPDVLLPQKMASVLIFKRTESGYIGTGPYRPIATSLERFSSYWGTKPTYETLTLKPLLSKQEKLSALAVSSVDVIMNIPADVAGDFSYTSYSLAVQPGVETDMLLMNTSGVLADSSIRKAVQTAIDPQTLTRFGHGFATVTNQLVPMAVFGFNPAISLRTADPQSAKILLSQRSTSSVDSITLDLPVGLESIGKTISAQLNAASIPHSVSYLSGEDLSTKIVHAASTFYFFGWQHDLGDSLPFLASVLHSRNGTFGEFNGMNYANKQVDALIEQALMTSDPALRRELQRQVMKIAVVDDAIAVPLFSPDSLYAVKKGIIFSPRVDGYVLANDFVVE